jgi:DNA ligase 1
MINIREPMLAGTPDNVADIRMPVLASPKLDGIRCLIIGGKALTRKFKPVKNTFVRVYLERFAVDGLDGELMVRGGFSEVSSGIMKETGEPDFTYNVFDYVGDSLTVPFEERYEWLLGIVEGLRDPLRRIKVVPHEWVASQEDLLEFEKGCLAKGFEGAMTRSPGGPYKTGRSTANEQYLLKVKRFKDSEAIVLECRPQFHNDNEAVKDALGHTKRSTAKDGMVELDTLGRFLVRDLKTKMEFELGTGQGLTVEVRKEIWTHRKATVGRIVKYKYQEIGSQGLPRFPIWLGFRDPDDMGE